ncbi:MAG TPA: histidine phosphatase family protein [Clostridia bacterium]
MTHVFFVRHAQSDKSWKDDRTRPLTEIGWGDRKKVTDVLARMRIDCFYSSPYKRSVDTISDCASVLNKIILTDERLRERKSGEEGYGIDMLERRWEDFNFCEEGGECLASVRKRNIEALNEILTSHKDENIVIGTHGTALSTIINYYDPGFNCDGFKRIWFWMPYIVRMDFSGTDYIGMEELLAVERGY